MQIERLLEMVYVLLEQKGITAKQLSKQFKVSQRTIYRDIDTLSLAGIPIYTEKGKGGGIALLPEFILNKSILSEQEQHDILSALQTLSSIQSPKTDQTLKKLSALFKKNAKDWLQVDLSEWGFSKNNYFNDFKTAILQQRIIEFDYYSSNGEKTHRQIEPIQLWFKKSWYIKGFCLLRQEMRFFRLTRVKNLKVTNKLFLGRDTESLNLDNTAKEQNQYLIDIKLKIEPEMTYRIFDDFDENTIEKQPDGSFIVSVTWPEGYWVYGLILSYGEYIEVLEPERIREIIKNKASQIENKYL